MAAHSCAVRTPLVILVRKCGRKLDVMSTRLLRSLIVSCMAGLLLVLAVPAAAQESEAPVSSASLAPAVEEAVSAEAEGAPSVAFDSEGETTIPVAQQHFRRGVEIYNRGQYGEALTEFNRALALDPSLEAAKTYREKCTAKLQLSAAGARPSAVTVYETFDPESITSTPEAPQLSAQEIKVQRVEKLLKDGELYLEHKRYETAAEIFEEVLLIAPDNRRARKGLHDATLGLREQAIAESEIGVKEDRASIYQYIEQSKNLPEGAGPTGIKPFRVTVPVLEEEYAPPVRRSEVEEILDSPVSIDFEEIDLRDIIQFLETTFDLNIHVDYRWRNWAERLWVEQHDTPYDPSMGEAPYYWVKYIKMENVPLRHALDALFRPRHLAYKVRPGYIYASVPWALRYETFEELETRFYDLRFLGGEWLWKIVLVNSFGGGRSYG
ncbi:MAG TPA: tetratricopeptide repeat protein, partial [Candidatus Hydrogenedentes bacterium]|nr:tetratricopeptide repeat protein [Candidatus Hydrogenedentota bacterium]